MSYPTHGNEYHERQSWKVPCRAATTANITIATDLNNGDTLDGVTLATGDRVLVKDQTTGSQNGVYIVGASPARAVDYASSAEIVGSAIVVTEGTANGGKAWVCTTPAPITVGTTALTFSGLGSGGGADPRITGTGTGNLRFEDGSESIHLEMLVGQWAGLDLMEAGTATLFAGLVSNAYVFMAENWSRIVVPMTAADLSDQGLSLELGPAGRLYFAAKDATTMQIYPLAGGYSIELTDRNAGLFKHVSEAGDVSIPALGRLRVLSAAPGSPTEGDSYYDSTLHKTRTYDGTTWQNHW